MAKMRDVLAWKINVHGQNTRQSIALCGMNVRQGMRRHRPVQASPWTGCLSTGHSKEYGTEGRKATGQEWVSTPVLFDIPDEVLCHRSKSPITSSMIRRIARTPHRSLRR